MQHLITDLAERAAELRARIELRSVFQAARDAGLMEDAAAALLRLRRQRLMLLLVLLVLAALGGLL